MYSFIACLILLILFYLIILLLNKLFSKCKENKSCCYRALYKIVSKITAIMTFSVFIRNSLEITQFVILSSINELNVFDTSSLLRIVSLVYAMLMIFAFLCTFGTTLFLTFSSYKTNEGHHSMLGELINSLQNNTKSKFYAVLILIRKLFFVLVLIILDSIESKKIIFILSCFQVGYTAYVAVVRPYNSIKLNIYEIINEVDYTLHLICLMLFNTKDDWNDISTSIYMWTLAINAMVVFVIVFIAFISLIAQCIMRKWNNKVRAEINEHRVVAKPNDDSTSKIQPQRIIKGKRFMGGQSQLTINQLVEEVKMDHHRNQYATSDQIVDDIDVQIAIKFDQ